VPSGADASARAIPCRIVWRHSWAPHLFSFGLARPAGLDYAAGQFVRLGVAAADGSLLWRAYSIASAPSEPDLAFYSIVVPDGPFSQRLVQLPVGDVVQLDPTVYGFLRVDRFSGGRQLWLLATGTGIAPFRAMLADPSTWARFDDIVLVHSVRTEAELAYRDAFERWASTPPDPRVRFRYRPTLTAGAPDARIPALLESGRLEGQTELAITANDSRLMIACNPSMIRQTREILNARGLGPVRRQTPGQYIVENFW
jgi:ferredoxin--NADP+ reductase